MESNVREEEEEVLNRTRLPSSSSSKKILQCKDQWGWDVNQKSSEVTIFGRKGQTALFHSTWSSGSVSSLTFRTIDFLPELLLDLHPYLTPNLVLFVNLFSSTGSSSRREDSQLISSLAILLGDSSG